MVNGNSHTKSKLIQMLMTKANERLEATVNASARANVIGATVSAMLPILRQYTGINKIVAEKVRKACASVGKK